MEKLDDKQRAFAEQHHRLIYSFLNQNGLDENDFYDIAAIGYLKSIKKYFDEESSFFECMLKPLGEKRKTFTDDHIKTLTDIYGNAMLGVSKCEYRKIFDEDDFAYCKVVVERPLQLNFQTSTERIKRVREQTAFANLAKDRKRKPEGIAREVAEGEKQQERF